MMYWLVIGFSFFPFTSFDSPMLAQDDREPRRRPVVSKAFCRIESKAKGRIEKPSSTFLPAVAPLGAMADRRLATPRSSRWSKASRGIETNGESFQLNSNLFTQALEEQTAGNYSKALEIYGALEPKTAAVWNNMAIAASHTDDALHAQLYRLRAQKNNTYGCPPLTIQILFFCLFSVFLIFVIQYRKKKKYVTICLLGLMSAISGIVTYQLYREQKKNYGLVMEDCPVYIGPDALYHISDQIKHGTKVLISGGYNEWKQITWNNKKGWIPNTVIEII